MGVKNLWKPRGLNKASLEQRDKVSLEQLQGMRARQAPGTMVPGLRTGTAWPAGPAGPNEGREGMRTHVT